MPRPAYWDQLPVPDGVGAPIDDPALDAALGLSPSQAYSGAWALTGDAHTVAAEYQQALPALGMQTLDPVENDGALVVPAPGVRRVSPGVVIFSADALASDDTLAEVQQYVPAGQGLVLGARVPASRAEPFVRRVLCSWWGSRWWLPTSCSSRRRRVLESMAPAACTAGSPASIQGGPGAASDTEVIEIVTGWHAFGRASAGAQAETGTTACTTTLSATNPNVVGYSGRGPARAWLYTDLLAFAPLYAALLWLDARLGARRSGSAARPATGATTRPTRCCGPPAGRAGNGGWSPSSAWRW